MQEEIATAGEKSTQSDAFQVFFNLDSERDSIAYKLAVEHSGNPQYQGPDRVVMQWRVAVSVRAEEGVEIHDDNAKHKITARVTLFEGLNGLFFFLAGQAIGVERSPKDYEFTKLRAAVKERNERLALLPPDTISLFGTKLGGITEAVKSAAVLDLRAAKNFTFAESKAPVLGIIDGPSQRNWIEVEGKTALIHKPIPRNGRRKGHTLQTLFDVPIDSQLARHHNIDASQLNVEWMRTQLKSMGFEAAITFKVLLGAILSHDNLRPEMSIDDIIDAMGRGEDARQGQREELRALVYNWILCFDSMPVIGLRSHASAWKEPRDKASKSKRAVIPAENLRSEDALIKIIGRQSTSTGVPKFVTLTAGPWIDQWKGNREILSDFGRVSDVATIKRGKPSGAWAACALLGLQQFWREEATYATKKTVGQDNHFTLAYRPITRRELLVDWWRPCEEQSVERVLNGPKPKRGQDYFNSAIKILKQAGHLGYFQELEPLPTTNWQERWLNQPLDIRPAGKYLADAVTIHDLCEAARKRGASHRSVLQKKAQKQ